VWRRESDRHFGTERRTKPGSERRAERGGKCSAEQCARQCVGQQRCGVCRSGIGGGERRGHACSISTPGGDTIGRRDPGGIGQCCLLCHG
jgi:hypothetical protein